MNKAKRKRVDNALFKAFQHLQKCYELIGGIRDAYTHEGGPEHEVKSHCNKIRGQINSVQQLEQGLYDAVRKTPGE